MSDTEGNDWAGRVNRLVSGSIQEQLHTISKDVREGFESSGETVSVIRGEFDGLAEKLLVRAKDDFMRLGELIFSMSTTLSEVVGELKEVRTALEDRISAVEYRVETLESRIDALEEREKPPSKAKAIPLRIDRKERQKVASRL